MTLHSFFEVKPAAVQYARLRPANLDVMQTANRHVLSLAIDEISMIGQKSLGHCALRAGDVFKNGTTAELATEAPEFSTFGGLPSVLFLGDILQLPPIADQPLFDLPANLPATSVSHIGKATYTAFQDAYVLSTAVRQDQHSEY